MPPEPTTIEITNFGGRLTRKINGDLNSGFAKYSTSFGYDPFSKPDNLTWLEQPTSILGSTTEMILAAKTRAEGLAPAIQYVYAVGSSGTLYKIQPSSQGTPNNPNLDTASVIGLIADNTPSFTFGASMDFFGATEKIYVGSNTQVNSINFDGSGDTRVGAGGYLSNSFRPLRQFIGKLLFGNGNTFGAIDATGIVTSSIIGTGQGNLYSELNPPLSVESSIHDMDLSPDGNYLMVTASNISNENITTAVRDTQSGAASEGALYLWNGTDSAITATTSIPSYAVTALQSYLSKNVFFSNDSFGASLSDGINKLLTLPNSKSPLPNATLVTGNFISWISPELSPGGSNRVASMYYFGSLDGENAPGLYRVLRYASTLASGFIYQTPLNLMVSNKYTSLSSDKTGISTYGYGKHYISIWDLNSTTNNYRLLRFLITPTGTGIPQFGVYETQTQLFTKKVTVKQIRIYTEPTVAGNGFQLDIIGSDGNFFANAVSQYTFAAGTDVTLLQGALERIVFNPSFQSSYAIGIRVTNTGTTNMTIKKIEVDWIYSGK